jgi:predicted TIM-barrel fold metal-dependent hydrolase
MNSFILSLINTNSRIFGVSRILRIDTAPESQDTIGRFVKEIGPERILFASDIPFGNMKNELNKVLSLPIGDAEKELILSKNLKRLIGLD